MVVSVQEVACPTDLRFWLQLQIVGRDGTAGQTWVDLNGDKSLYGRTKMKLEPARDSPCLRVAAASVGFGD